MIGSKGGARRPGHSLAMILLGCLVLAGAVPGCSSGPSRKVTYPVAGQVLVDGQPAENVAVRAVQTEGYDASDPTYAAAFTDSEGRFALSTYERGDGIAAGKYALTFVWGQVNPLSMSYGGPDKLKGRYNDPAKSQFIVDVGPDAKLDGARPEDAKLDLGRIELKTR